MASSDLHRPPPNQKIVRRKKTRELPNLSDCNACKRRTNSTNPSERLRILNSHWRIVLLCKSCYNRVESCNLCSYCLTDHPESEDSGADKCRKCNRRVHRACVSRYSSFPPFSYLPTAAELGTHGFAICIDCWMPTLIDSKGKVKVGTISCSPGVSRVSDIQENPKSAEEVANDADCAARKMALVAVAAKEKAVMKAEVARGAVQLANGALDLVYPDETLALRLHRAMNSSPRIAKSLHLSSGDCTKSIEALKISDNSSSEKLSRLEENVIELESQAPMETSSIKMIGGCEDNSAHVESQSCDNKPVVEGAADLECDRFFQRKYTRRASLNS